MSKLSFALIDLEMVRFFDMNESKSFISVTDAELKHHQNNGETVMKAAFLNVRKNEIEIVVPEDAIK